MRSLRPFYWSIAVTVLALVAAGVLKGGEAVFITAILIVLEVSLSFDNAVVNATVLRRMSPFWQQMFLTVGIVIAVFGMRLVFPIVVVAVAASLSPAAVIDQAFNDPETYSANLADAHASIASFGGIFLLMVFLDFMFDPQRENTWIRGIEPFLMRIGLLPNVTVLTAAGTLLIVGQWVDHQHQLAVMVSGLAGLVTYVGVNSLTCLLDSRAGTNTNGAVAQAGFATFVYINILDASFSFDGVIGAFAISDDVVIIALGLGVGALYVRSTTVFLVRRGTLERFMFLENGAHWAIGALAVLLFISIGVHVSEIITGLLGVLFIGASLLSSIRENRRNPERLAPLATDAAQAANTPVTSSPRVTTGAGRGRGD